MHGGEFVHLVSLVHCVRLVQRKHIPDQPAKPDRLPSSRSFASPDLAIDQADQEGRISLILCSLHFNNELLPCGVSLHAKRSGLLRIDPLMITLILHLTP